MINLRYHIVSIVGVFLALGIGVALGSTFVDGFVVSTLEDRVNNLEGDRNNLRDELSDVNEQLADEQADRAAQEIAAIPLIGAGRLTDVPVMIIATDGMEEAAFQTVRAALLGTNAQYEGTLWLTDRLNLSDSSNRADLAEALDLVDDNETLVRRALETRLVTALFPPAPDEAGTVLGGTASEIVEELLSTATEDLRVDAPPVTGRLTSVLTQLRDAAFVRYDNEFAVTGALDGIPVHGTRFILLGDANAELDPAEILLRLLDAVVEEDIDVSIVALDVTTNPDDSDLASEVDVSFIRPIRSNSLYRGRVATVDQATTFSGLLSALALLDTGEVRHLGVGAGATAEFPPT